MNDLLQFATEIAVKAGDITLKYFRGDIKVDSKADASPVTIADRESEEFLRSEIEKRFPEDAILGEEYGKKSGTSGRRWILDPIDGTKSFIRGVAMYGTMVALEDNGEAIVGVICYPGSGETLAGAKGLGCKYNGQPCAVSKTPEIKQAAALTTDPAHIIQHFGEKRLLSYINGTGLVRTWGDCYGYLLVATGRADIMFDPIVNVWDAAALIPIIEESGGKITDAAGASGLGIKNVVASNGLLHEAALNLLRG